MMGQPEFHYMWQRPRRPRYAIDRVCTRRAREPSWHTLGTTGVRPSSPVGSRYEADLPEHWWARTVSNRRPLVCKGKGTSEHRFHGVQYVQFRAWHLSTAFGRVHAVRPHLGN